MMLHDPQLLHALLAHLTAAIISYAGYQIEAGAQVRLGIQVPPCLFLFSMSLVFGRAFWGFETYQSDAGAQARFSFLVFSFFL
jgi:hypothetical protein